MRNAFYSIDVPQSRYEKPHQLLGISPTDGTTNDLMSRFGSYLMVKAGAFTDDELRKLPLSKVLGPWYKKFEREHPDRTDEITRHKEHLDEIELWEQNNL